jgi:hypothetical protein
MRHGLVPSSECPGCLVMSDSYSRYPFAITRRGKFPFIGECDIIIQTMYCKPYGCIYLKGKAKIELIGSHKLDCVQKLAQYKWIGRHNVRN